MDSSGGNKNNVVSYINNIQYIYRLGAGDIGHFSFLLIVKKTFSKHLFIALMITKISK